MFLPWAVPGLGWVGRSVISGVFAIKEIVVEQTLVSLLFDPNGTCPWRDVHDDPMDD